MFAVMAVPAMATLDNAGVYQSYDGNTDDLSGNGYPATLEGTAAIDTSLFKVGNGSLESDGGTGNYAQINNYTSVIGSDNAGTISMWVYPHGTNTDYFVGVANTASAANRFRIITLSSGVWQVSMRAGSTSPRYEYNVGSYTPNNWYHVALVQDGTTGNEFFINGVSVKNNSNTHWFNDMSGLNSIVIAGRAYQDNNHFDGNVDEFAYYDYALSAAEVRELYNNGTGFNPYASPPVTSFNITAANAETAAAINTFNVTLNSTTYTTTNGTIIVPTSGFYTTVVQSPGFIPVTTSKTYAGGSSTQWNLTSILRNVTVSAFDGDGLPVSNFNVSINGTSYNVAGSSDVFELDRTVLHNFTFSKTDYYSDVQTNVNVTSNVQGTLNSVFKDTTFTAQDETNASLSNFNVTINGTTTNIAGASGTINLDSRELFNATWSKTNYIPFTATNLNPNSSHLGNLTEYFNILVYTNTSTTVTGQNYSNTTGYYGFDGNLLDRSDNMFNLTGTNSAIDYTNYVLGNGSVQFTAGYADSNALGTDISTFGSWGYCTWVYPTDAEFNLITVQDSTGTGDTFVTKNNVASGLFMFYTGPGDQAYYSTGLVTDVWQHVCYTNDGSENRLYVNGTVVANSSASVTPVTHGTYNLTRLGARVPKSGIPSADLSINANFDEFVVWDYAPNATFISSLYNNGTGYNPYANASNTTTFTTTDEYFVNWNSTNYYPQADNITYLPVRYSLENFTVNPTTPAFKQAVFNNYNTTTHLNLTFNNSHAVTATNRFNSAAILNFTVETPTQNYTSINGTAYLQNDTGVINYTVSATDFFDVENAGVNVTNGSSSVLMHQVEVRFNGSQRFTNNTVADGNVTIGATTRAFNETFYLNAGTYEAFYSSSNDEAKPINFTYTALTNTTSTITNITNANLTITGINAVDGTPITFFTTVVNNSTLSISLNKTEASPHLYNLIQNVTYNVQFDNSSFALNDTNITLTNRSSSYVFYVYTTNSFNISILDEQNSSHITDTNFTIEFIGSYQSYNYTYENGTLYADLIVPDLYQIRYEYINGSGATNYGLHRQYFHQLTNRTHNPLDFYALKDDASTRVTINVQNSDTLQRQEGVYVLLQRFYLANNSYNTVAMYETDSQGNAYFDVELQDELYRFVLQSPFGTTLRTTTPAYLEETSYIIYTGDTQTTFANPIGLGDINATFDWDNSTETLTVTYSDPENIYGTYTLNLYEEGVYTNTLINTSSATTSSGTLVVSYAFQNDTEYIGTMTVSNSPAIVAASFRISDFTAGMPLANLSLFLVSILFVIMTFISAFSLYSVVLGAVALIAASMMGLLTFSGPVVGMIVFGAIMLAIVLEWRRG